MMNKKVLWACSIVIFLAVVGSIAYMEQMKKPKNVSYEEAIEILNEGEVAVIFQSHSKVVVMYRKDQRTIRTVEPEIDDIFREVAKCGEKCKGVHWLVE